MAWTTSRMPEGLEAGGTALTAGGRPGGVAQAGEAHPVRACQTSEAEPGSKTLLLPAVSL